MGLEKSASSTAQPENSTTANKDEDEDEDELEDGEIGDDEDDELWKQLESSLESSSNRPKSNSNSPSVLNKSNETIKENSQSSTPASQRSSLYRTSDGFWAKLKSMTGNSNGEGQSTEGIPIGGDFRPDGGAIQHSETSGASNSIKIDQNGSPPRLVHAKHRLGQSFGLYDSDFSFGTPPIYRGNDSIEIVESATDHSNIRRVSTTIEGDLKVSIPSVEQPQDDELMELQLRLIALQSTMNRSGSKRESMNRTSERRRKYSHRHLERSGRDHDRSRRESSRPKSYRHDRFDVDDRDGSEERRRRRERYERGSVGKWRDSVRRTPRARSKERSARSPSPTINPIRENPEESPNFAVKILSMPDPRDQLRAARAFLDMVTQQHPLSQAPNAIDSGTDRGDNLIATNMDLASDDDSCMVQIGNEADLYHPSDDEESSSKVPYVPFLSSSRISVLSTPTLSGFWSRPPSSKSQQQQQPPSLVLRELDNDAHKVTSGTSNTADPTVEKEPPKTVSTAVDDDEPDDDEMEALRELALSSMLKTKKSKDDSSPIMDDAQATAKAAATVENKAPATDEDPPLDPESDGEIVIAFDRSYLKKQLALARKNAQESMSAECVAAESPRSESPATSAVIPEDLLKREESQDAQSTNQHSKSIENAMDTLQKDQVFDASSPASSTATVDPSPSTATVDKSKSKALVLRPASKKVQAPRFIQKPVVIALDTESSTGEDDDDSNAASTSTGNKSKKSRSTASAQSRTQQILGEFLRPRIKLGNVPTQVNTPPRPSSSSNSEIGSASNGLVGKQLETKLSECANDLAKHENALTEDKKRLRTLESNVSRQKTELRAAEMRMQKLKEELRKVESHTALHRVSIAKFNGEIQKVQTRVDKNQKLHGMFLRQWKEIEQLVTKYKISVPSASPDVGQSTPTTPTIRKNMADLLARPATASPIRSMAMRKLAITRRRMSKSFSGGNKRKTSGTEASNKASAADSGEDGTSDILTAPLRMFKSYRLSPSFRTLDQSKHDSVSFANKLNPFVPLCPFDLSGECMDPECQWQHTRDYQLTEVEMIADLLSYEPGAVTDGADETTTMAFATELHNSLSGQLPLNDILLYCLSKMDGHVRETGGAKLGVQCDPRRWILHQNPERYNTEAVQLNEPVVLDPMDVENESSGPRYYDDPDLDAPAIVQPSEPMDDGERVIEDAAIDSEVSEPKDNVDLENPIVESSTSLINPTIEDDGNPEITNDDKNTENPSMVVDQENSASNDNDSVIIIDDDEEEKTVDSDIEIIDDDCQEVTVVASRKPQGALKSEPHSYKFGDQHDH